jgi:tetratricopeptide (TPR) repeat protein
LKAAALPDQTEPQTEQQPAPVQAEQPQSAQEPAAPQPEQDAAQQAEAARRKEVEQLWREIQLLALRAENLEASGRYDEAAELLSAAIARLQTRPHDDLDMVPLRQLLWDMLHAAGRYEEALAQAQAVHEAITAAYGVGSAEAHLVAVRLGISSAACDQPGPALRLIHDAVQVLEHNLGGMLERGQELAAAATAEGASEENQQELEVLQRAIDKVAAAMGEGNFYGGLITLHFAAQEGQQQGAGRLGHGLGGVWPGAGPRLGG